MPRLLARPTSRKSPQLLQLLLGERRTHARDHRLEARLAQRDHVRVPLDDTDAVLAVDRLPREVEPVDHGALREQLGLRGVDVLRLQRVVVVEAPRLEAQHAPARVGEREDEPPLEVVAAAPPGEAGGLQLVCGVALLARLPPERGAADREPEPELAAHLFA